ncbi:flagellin [Pseudalkalibacillus sp. SCS-8]|uniref:flagellin N-terminal helical domain-containing protein n=1 Tax=Pseudalkalibacillus nanhaiensis TaxID=3115291 RepID=UPI0032DAD816
MRINHNIAALNTYRQLGSANNMQMKSMEKLSSGLRINRAGDDAAGLSISEKMRGQIRGLDQASRNAQDGISMIQTAEGALNETHSILQRMNELATQAANGTLSSNDRTAIADEITELNSEIDRIASSTKFNGQTLLDGTLGVQQNKTTSGIQVGTAGVTGIDISGAAATETYQMSTSGAGQYTLTTSGGDVQNLTLADGTAGTLNFDKLGVKITVDGSQTAAGIVASNVGTTAGAVTTTGSAAVSLQIGSEDVGAQKLGITIGDMDSTSLGVNAVDVSTSANAGQAMDDIQSAIDTVSAQRSKLGAYQNRLEHTINNLGTTSENLTAAESRIRDVDYAIAA